MPTYTFATGVPNITPAVYDVNDTETDLNTTPTATASNGVLSLVLDAGDYYAEWDAQGDTHRTGGAVVARDPDTYQDADAPSGSSPLLLVWDSDTTDYIPTESKDATGPKVFVGPTDPTTVTGAVLNGYDQWVETTF